MHDAPYQTQTVRLLIADDDTVLRTTLGKIYRKAGYEVVLAADGDEAVRCAQAQAFDLALLDLSMPRKTGIEALKELKQIAPNMPVIILTAIGDWGTYAEALSCGVDQFISKPVRQDDLLLMVKEALEKRDKRDEEMRE